MRRLLFVALSAAAVACSGGDAASPAACTPVTRTADDTFAQAHAADSPEITLARAIADRWLTEHPPEALTWNWTDGVLAAGLVDLWRVTADPRYRDYLQAYIDHHVAAGYAVTTSDRCPPAIAAAELYATSCKDDYLSVVETVLDYLDNQALRTDDGGINHLGTSPLFPPSLWIDSLYMFGTVLIRWGAQQHDAHALDMYASQYGIFASHLQDPSGFFVHAYNWATPQDPDVFWARGNGWVLTSGYDYLLARQARGEHDAAVSASLAKLAAAVIAAQDPATGLYWTVVNRPGETYLETSGSALFAAGLARGRRAGALDASVVASVKHAVEGIRTRITTDAQGRPVVTGTSGPTSVGKFSDYASVPMEDDLDYGVGAVLLALVDASGLQ